MSESEIQIKALSYAAWRALAAEGFRDVAGTIEHAIRSALSGDASAFGKYLSSIDLPITEGWLKEAGFKWHQIDLQPHKQWCLWMGRCIDHPDNWSSPEDFGIELCQGAYNGPNRSDSWFCWFRGDSAGRYHRFIHVRHLSTEAEVIRLIEALSGREWKPENHIYGEVLCQNCADRWRKERERLDLRVGKMRNTPWYEVEKDDTRDRALPEHLDEAIKRGGAK